MHHQGEVVEPGAIEAKVAEKGQDVEVSVGKTDESKEAQCLVKHNWILFCE